MIEEAQHDQSLNDQTLETQKTSENMIPKSVVRVERIMKFNTSSKIQLTSKPMVLPCNLKSSA